MRTLDVWRQTSGEEEKLDKSVYRWGETPQYFCMHLIWTSDKKTEPGSWPIYLTSSIMLPLQMFSCVFIVNYGLDAYAFVELV